MVSLAFKQKYGRPSFWAAFSFIKKYGNYNKKVLYIAKRRGLLRKLSHYKGVKMKKALLFNLCEMVLIVPIIVAVVSLTNIQPTPRPGWAIRSTVERRFYHEVNPNLVDAIADFKTPIMPVL